MTNLRQLLVFQHIGRCSLASRIYHGTAAVPLTIRLGRPIAWGRSSLGGCWRCRGTWWRFPSDVVRCRRPARRWRVRPDRLPPPPPPPRQQVPAPPAAWWLNREQVTLPSGAHLPVFMALLSLMVALPLGPAHLPEAGRWRARRADCSLPAEDRQRLHRQFGWRVRNAHYSQRIPRNVHNVRLLTVS